MPYLVKQHITAVDVNGDAHVHPEGSVVSDWELSDFIREKIAEGSQHYRERYEPLLDHEAHHYRVKATKAAGPRYVPGDDQPMQPPFDDYVGLHPTEIIDRLRVASLDLVRHTQRFEESGLNRRVIVDYVSPAEREPWEDYDSKDVREILEKFSVVPDSAVADAIAYERSLKNRDAITTYDREVYEGRVPEAFART